MPAPCPLRLRRCERDIDEHADCFRLLRVDQPLHAGAEGDAVRAELGELVGVGAGRETHDQLGRHRRAGGSVHGRPLDRSNHKPIRQRACHRRRLHQRRRGREHRQGEWRGRVRAGGQVGTGRCGDPRGARWVHRVDQRLPRVVVRRGAGPQRRPVRERGGAFVVGDATIEPVDVHVVGIDAHPQGGAVGGIARFEPDRQQGERHIGFKVAGIGCKGGNELGELVIDRTQARGAGARLGAEVGGSFAGALKSGGISERGCRLGRGCRGIGGIRE
jgi:hypothetical protein